MDDKVRSLLTQILRYLHSQFGTILLITINFGSFESKTGYYNSSTNYVNNTNDKSQKLTIKSHKTIIIKANNQIK